jgi:hypothetical protein
MTSFVIGWMRFALSGRSWTISDKALRALVVARASNHSDIENKNVTAAASVNSWRANAPTAAVNINTFVSN